MSAPCRIWKTPETTASVERLWRWRCAEHPWAEYGGTAGSMPAALGELAAHVATDHGSLAVRNVLNINTGRDMS